MNINQYFEVYSQIQIFLDRIIAFSVKGYDISSLQGLMTFMSSILFIFLKFFAFLFLTLFAALIVLRFFRAEGIVVMPFETPSNDEIKYSGKAISHLLAGELGRIKSAHNFKFSPVYITFEALMDQKVFLMAENLDFSGITPEKETLEFSMNNIGTLQAGTTSLSPGNLIMTFKRFFPWSKPVPVLTGSLGIFGSVIKLMGCLESQNVLASEVSKKITSKFTKDEHIPDMISELAFRIVFKMETEKLKPSISAKTWQGFKYLTEALEAYRIYIQTGKGDELDRSRECILQAVDSEPDYAAAIQTLKTIGYVYLDKKEYTQAKNLFELLCEKDKYKFDGFSGLGIANFKDNKQDIALENFENAKKIKPQDFQIIFYKGVTLYHLKKPDEALLEFDEALKIKQNVAAWYYKGIIRILQEDLSASNDFEHAIQIPPQDSRDWFYRAWALLMLNEYEPALMALEKVIETHPCYLRVWLSKAYIHDLLGDTNKKDNDCDKALENYQNSIDAYSKAIDINPENEFAFNLRNDVIGKKMELIRLGLTRTMETISKLNKDRQEKSGIKKL